MRKSNADPFALVGILLLLAIKTSNAQQTADPDFDTTVENPAYPKQGPTVAIDQAHSNFHTADGRYRPFAELLSTDGYKVAANEREFAPGSLDAVDILVIANANAGNLVDPAFALNVSFIGSRGYWATNRAARSKVIVRTDSANEHGDACDGAASSDRQMVVTSSHAPRELR